MGVARLRRNSLRASLVCALSGSDALGMVVEGIQRRFSGALRAGEVAGCCATPQCLATILRPGERDGSGHGALPDSSPTSARRLGGVTRVASRSRAHPGVESFLAAVGDHMRLARAGAKVLQPKEIIYYGSVSHRSGNC